MRIPEPVFCFGGGGGGGDKKQAAPAINKTSGENYDGAKPAARPPGSAVDPATGGLLTDQTKPKSILGAG